MSQVFASGTLRRHPKGFDEVTGTRSRIVDVLTVYGRRFACQFPIKPRTQLPCLQFIRRTPASPSRALRHALLARFGESELLEIVVGVPAKQSEISHRRYVPPRRVLGARPSE